MRIYLSLFHLAYGLHGFILSVKWATHLPRHMAMILQWLTLSQPDSTPTAEDDMKAAICTNLSWLKDKSSAMECLPFDVHRMLLPLTQRAGYSIAAILPV